MSLTQWILTAALLAWALLRNVGARRVTAQTFAVPVAVVVVAAVAFLVPLPAAGNDLALVGVFAAAGAALGLLTSAATRVQVRDGAVVATAGLGFALVWLAVIAGRIAFAEWATGPGARTVGEFSRDHLITGADAWTAAFVVLALVMVLTRTVALAVRTSRARTATSALTAPTAA
ncbi:MAG: hypothetical protein R2737_07335 [Candidatus Nanopelagicales bacterium]